MFLTRFVNQGPESNYLRMGPSDIDESNTFMTQQQFQQQLEQFKQQFQPPPSVDYYGPIKPPEYGSPLVGAGTAEDPYRLPTELQLESTYDPSYMARLGEYAYGEEPSPWLERQHELIGLDYATGREDLDAQLAGSMQQAREQLAMRGGMRTGAAERLEETGIWGQMMERQRLGRERQRQILGAELAEEESKLGIREQLPGMELSREQQDLARQEADIARLMDEQRFRYGTEQEKYKTQMAAWAAEQLGAATERAAGKDRGFLGNMFSSIF